MSKFNMSKIKGLNEMTERNGETRTAVGAGLLSEVSKQLVSEDMRLVYLDREQIKTNQRNFYSITDIDSLKKSIQAVGLRQPLEVIQNADGSYRLTGGERRLTAIDELIKEGSWNKKIPCLPQELDKISLPLDDDDKEMFAIITVNREQRTYTDGDTAREVTELKRIYKNLKDKGVEWIRTEEGDEIQLKGKKTRELVAETLGISTGQVSNFEKVENKGSKALKESLLNNELSIGTAAEIADLPKDEQEEFLVKTKEKKEGENIDRGDLLKFQKEKKEEQLQISGKSDKIKTDGQEEQKVENERPAGNTVGVAEWKKDTADILKALKGKEAALNESQYFTYLNCLDKLRRILIEDR